MALRKCGGGSEKASLADPTFARDDERPAFALRSVCEERLDLGELLAAPDEREFRSAETG